MRSESGATMGANAGVMPGNPRQRYRPARSGGGHGISRAIRNLPLRRLPQLAWRCLGDGAGDGNRTHVSSLGSCSSTIELHPRAENCTRGTARAAIGSFAVCRFRAKLPGGETAWVGDLAVLPSRTSSVTWYASDASSRHAESRGDPFGPSESDAGAECVCCPLRRRSLIRPFGFHRECEGYSAIPGPAAGARGGLGSGSRQAHRHP